VSAVLLELLICRFPTILLVTRSDRLYG